jgi:hypothetical protein
MQALRNATLLARLVLAWFALSIGVAVASPVVNPQAIELICSGGVVKLAASGENSGQPATNHTLDCPLCAPLVAPPAAAQGQAQPLPLGHVLRSIPAARIAALTAAPPPGRGPPAPLAI